MKDLRTIIGDNLTQLRKNKKLTQLELADKFNYSDKAVSKWEKGDTLPDIEILKQLCDFYDITLDDLTKEDLIVLQSGDIDRKTEISNHVWMSALIGTSPWMVATIAFVYTMVALSPDHLWYSFWPVFVWACPISCLLGAICNKLFFRNKHLSFILWSSGLWTLVASFYIACGYFEKSNWSALWPLFLICVPLQAALVIWKEMLKKNKKK